MAAARLATAGNGPPVIYAGQDPAVLALTPAGRILYVADQGRPLPGLRLSGHTVVPVSLAAGSAGRPIQVGTWPAFMLITPDGKTLYVAADDGSVTPVSVASGRPGPPIRVAQSPCALAVTPDGRTLYVADCGHTVTPVPVATGRPGPPIKVGISPDALAVTPDGRTLYVASYISNTVTPVDVATGKPGTPIVVGHAPVALALTPDGRTLYVAIDGEEPILPRRALCRPNNGRYRHAGPSDPRRPGSRRARHRP